MKADKIILGCIKFMQKKKNCVCFVYLVSLSHLVIGMAELLHHNSLRKFTFSSIKKTRTKGIQKLSWRPVQGVLTEDNKRAVVKNGKDSLDISRVVNGMWQTSGGWGRIDRDNAVDAMLKYADAALTTFDMADICIALNYQYLIVCVRCLHIHLDLSCHLPISVCHIWTYITLIC